jgi:hypothetical protein
MGRAEDLFDRLVQQGEMAIKAMIADRQSEELFLDFKRSADNGAGGKLHQDDRQNLSKALSGFGNSEGGVIVWGVDCRGKPNTGDVAQFEVPVENPKRFKSWLEGAVSGCTVPAHSTVRHEAIEKADGKGFVITLVPMSYLAPHQCIHDLRYYMRAGSDFSPVPHAVLAGLFGRRPQPALIINWLVESLKFEAGRAAGDRAIRLIAQLKLHNLGLAIARDLYINLEVWPPGPRSSITGHVSSNQWIQENVANVTLSAMSNEAFRLGPQGVTAPMSLTFVLARPFNRALNYKISYGCSGSPVTHVESTVEPSDLEKILRSSTVQQATALARVLLPKSNKAR